MRPKTVYLAQGAIIAALYTALAHLQNLILPGSATWAIQCRLAEALCVLAFFTPAAVPGLTLGTLLFSLSFAPALPLDWLLGTLATFLAVYAMRLTRRFQICGFPPALLLPALCNGVLVGWELTVYVGGGFFLNAFSVALGELLALLILGSSLYRLLLRPPLSSLFRN